MIEFHWIKRNFEGEEKKILFGISSYKERLSPILPGDVTIQFVSSIEEINSLQRKKTYTYKLIKAQQASWYGMPFRTILRFHKFSFEQLLNDKFIFETFLKLLNDAKI